MKKANKIVAILMSLILTLGVSMVALAEESNLVTSENELGVGQVVTGTTETTETTKTTEGKEENNDEKGRPDKNKNKNDWKIQKQLIEEAKDQIEELKDELEGRLKTLEAQLKEAVITGDASLIESLKTQIKEMKVQHSTYKVEMKNKIESMKQITKQQYTTEELSQLNKIYESFKSQKNIQSIPVENIFIKKGNVKFDTPPVIKSGRTLIPVRAITEGLGATVTWNGEEKLVTISKGDTVIIFNLANNKVYINDIEVTIDVPAEAMNNRTMVPLRFIAENLGLKVSWDNETGTIEVEEVIVDEVFVDEVIVEEETVEDKVN